MAKFCYYWRWKCYNCNMTWDPDDWAEFMETEEYKTLFDKGPGFTWCTCGCHLVKVTDWERIKKECGGRDEEDIL